MMEKTEKQIEGDVFTLIKSSEFVKGLSGAVYRAGMRADNSQLEDVVVKFLTGIDGQEQAGVVLIHVYVPDITSGNKNLVENVARVEKLQEGLNTWLDSLTSVEYEFTKDGTPKSFPAEGIPQHFINVRLHYRRISI